MSQEAAANGSQEAQARPAEANEEEMCTICLGPLENTVRIIPCRHTFCRDCIEPWAAERANCPLCRQLIGTLVSIAPRPRVNAAARRPRGRLPRRQERRERRRSPHRSRSVSPRRARHSPSRNPRRLVRSLSWQWELNGSSRFQPPWDIGEAERLRQLQEEQWGSGDHARARIRPRF